MPRVFERREFLSNLLQLSAALPLASCRTAMNLTESDLNVSRSEIIPSSALAYNLRYEDQMLITSALKRNSTLSYESEDILTLALEVLNSRKFKSLRIRSGGHSYIGACLAPEAYVLNLSPYDRIEIDRRIKIVSAGSGTRFYALTETLKNSLHNFFFPVPDLPTIALGGYALSGGVSILSPMLGFSADSIVAATALIFFKKDDVFQARRFRISAASEPDLFWAMMGCGAHIGVVTDLTFKLEQLSNCSIYLLSIQNVEFDQFRLIFRAWQNLCEKSLNPKTSCKLEYNSLRNIRMVGVAENHGQDLQKIEEFLGLFGGKLEIKPLDYSNLYIGIAGCNSLSECASSAWSASPNYFSAKTLLVEPRREISDESLNGISRCLSEIPALSLASIQFNRWSGKMTEPNSKVCLPHRNFAYDCQAIIKCQSRAVFNNGLIFDSWVDKAIALMGERKAALFSQICRGASQEPQIYFGDSWPRIQQIKKQYDPENIFEAFKGGDEI